MSSVNVVLKSVFDDRGIKNAMSGFNKIGRNVAKIGAAIGVAFSARAIVNFAGDAIKAAEAAQVANNRLDQIAKSMNIFGSNTGAVTQRLKDFATQQQLIIGQDDELIKSTQAKLLTFKDLAATAGQAGGSFDRATQAAFDLAAAGFGSAETNAVQLGKALQDPIKGLTALRRSGITFTEQQKEQIRTLVESGKTLEAQDLVLKAIETQVGGTAAATATASSKMKVAFGEMQESVGQALMPAFEELTKLLMPIVDELGPLLSEIFVAMAPILNTLVSAINPLIEATAPLKDVFIEIVEVLNEALLMIMPILIDLIKILAPVFVDLVRAILPLVQKLLPPLVKLIEALLPFIQMLADFLTDYLIPGLERFGNLLSDVVIWAVEGLTNSLNFLKGALEPVWLFLKPLIDGLLSLAGIENKQLNKQIKVDFSKTTAPAAFGLPGQTGAIAPISISGIGDIGGAGSSGGKTSLKEQFDKVRKIIKDAQGKLLKAEEDYNKAKVDINKQYNEEIKALETQYFEDRAEIVKESINRLRSAFRSATAIGLGDLFGTQTVTEMETQVKKLTDRLTVTVSKETQKTIGGTVSDLISGLTNRLSASKALLENASKLASAGFTQTFIEQVVETGTDTGNALASAILGASPEQQEALKKNFLELETVSETGIDAIAKKLNSGLTLATRELNQALEDLEKEYLEQSKAKQKQLADALAEAGYQFTQNISGIKTEFEAVIDSLDGKFAGLGSTIDALLAKMARLSGGAVTDIQAALIGKGGLLENATITQDVKAIKGAINASGIVIDSAADIAGSMAYIQARIDAANKYIKSSSSNAAQEAGAKAQIAGFTTELANLRAASTSGNAAGTIVNINVKTDTTQSAAMVGKTIGNVVTKYTTTGGKVLVSGQQ